MAANAFCNGNQSGEFTTIILSG